MTGAYCSAVESYNCEAPAGYRTGRGYAALKGVRKSELLTCAYCEELVCNECVTFMVPPAFFADQDPAPVGLDHSPEELADWLGLT